MQAVTYELKQILNPERRYIIPTFQRDYEWTREEQWELLFDDLDSVADRLVDARAYAEASNKPLTVVEKTVTPHFLGAIVCDQLPSSAGGIDLRAVIDGQQRLTTLQLLIRGVLDVLIEVNSSRVKQVRRLIRNPEDVVEQPHEIHKLWPRRRDRDVWPVAMDDQIPPNGPHLYLQARTYFAERTRSARIGTDGVDRTDAIVDALISLFKLVVIDLEDNDDAQVIFEVLNGRQTPLSASDLVKNLLFLRGELANEAELERLYERYWAPFDDPWWKEYVGSGHAARGRRDALLSAWLTVASGEEAKVGHLYGEVRSYLNRADRKTDEVLAELHQYGDGYRRIYAAEDPGSAELARLYRRLDRLGILTAVPLLLWLRALPPERLPRPDHERAVRAIDSWVVRRLITGSNTRGYGKAIVDVLNAAKSSAQDPTSSVADGVEQALLAAPHGLEWPTDHEIESAFVNSQFYNWHSQLRIRMMLGAIDEQLQRDNPKTEPASFDYDALQIEHLMPQSWRDHWPLDSPDEAENVLLSQARDRVVHRIGNLTLVAPSFNGAVSNLGWESKRPELAKQSKLQLNTALGAIDTWDEHAIEARARSLAAVAVRVWPRPS